MTWQTLNRNWSLLIGVTLCGTAMGQSADSQAASIPYLTHGPMLGEVTTHSARIWARASSSANLTVRVSESDGSPSSERRREDTPALPGREESSDGVDLGRETDLMGHVRIGGLQPATRYFYCLYLNGRPAMLPPYPSFVTAPPKAQGGHQRICFGSCVGRTAADPAATWADLAERTSIDVLLMLGDNHYADTTEPAGQRRFYSEQRRLAGFREITKRVPTYAIWDDHDFGPNNSDGTAPGKELSLQTFKEHWANPAYGEPDNPGVYYRFSRGDVDFFMLDVRYHRSPNKSADEPPGTKTMLGATQLAWLKRELLASEATVKLIASGSEWQPVSHVDSWASFARERDEIFEFIRMNEIEGVILLSGDRHFTGGYQINKRLIEITSGPLGAKNYATKNLPNMFYNEGVGKLYSVLDIDTTGNEPRVALEVYRAGEGLLVRQGFLWEQVNGRAEIQCLPVENSK